MKTLNDCLHSYKFRVYFDKRFVNGLLSGLRADNESLSFADWQSADSFAKRCDGKTVINPCAGSSSYTMQRPILEAI